MFTFQSWKIGKIMGIPIAIDASWLIIFALLTYELGTGIFPVELGNGFRRGLDAEALALGAAASLLLFASVLAHELSHAWMALRRGIPVLGITLFIFGGVAQIGDEPDRPATEFWIAIMGPLMSFALAILFALFWVWPEALRRLLPGTNSVLLPVAVIGAYLAQANALLVAFNLLPGFPLDGGRVFRALVWGLLGNLQRATFVAMALGRVIAGLLALGGVLLLIRDGLNGLWFILIGAFLWQAAGEAYRSVVLRDSLKAMSVGRLMQAPVPRVDADLNLARFVEDFLVRQRAMVFAVENNFHAVGVIGPLQVKSIPRAQWDALRVRDAMLPLPQTGAVTPADTALRVMQNLTRQDSDELPVVDGEEVVGVIGRDEIARYLRWKGNE